MLQRNKSKIGDQEELVFGLDIGIASVGWAVVASNRIVDLGVRCFDAAETGKEGNSLNLIRRFSRLARNRYHHKTDRLIELSKVMERVGLIASADFFKKQPGFATSTWVLRVDGLDRLLTPVEWSRVIYHICKHRGFHWTSKAEKVNNVADVTSENGKIKKSLAGTNQLMREKGYRTAAEMISIEFPKGQRNKQGEYTKALSREQLNEELTKLFILQRQFGNPHAHESLELLIRGDGDQKSGLLWQQKPSISGADLLKMLGKCTFERAEYRAPKASFTAERHVWLTQLNNMRVIVNGVSRSLTEVERQAVFLLPYQPKEFTYAAFRKFAVKTGLLPDSFRFGGLLYPSAQQKDGKKIKDPEDKPIGKMSAWHELRLAFANAKLGDVWQTISNDALNGKPDVLNQIALVLSVYKEDDEVKSELEKLNLPRANEIIEVLLNIRFSKFHALSLKALHNIVQHMERGLRYDEACIPSYGHHSQRASDQTVKYKYLPDIYSGRDKNGTMLLRDDIDAPNNPVVLRAFNQARKVVNALIKDYGSPVAIHIEMARDLSRPFDERNKISKLQEDFRCLNDKARDEFEDQFSRKPNGKDFEKWMLYREQGGQCAYSQKPLTASGDLNEIFNNGCTEIDHILPHSRSFDDSKNNKVLVLTRENQNKGNRTPYEYLTNFVGGESGERWNNFVAWVEQNKVYRSAKKDRLLRKNYGADESKGFRDRNLNDTRYICKFFKNYIENHLELAVRADGETDKRCVALNGQLTAFLRARWGLTKQRNESDRHHALDAVVIAVCSHSMVKRLADYSRFKEIQFLKDGIPDPETGEIMNFAAHDRLKKHFPVPWENFRHELEARLKTDDLAALRDDMARLGTYSEQELKDLRTLFVSRAPQRLNVGAAHKDTIYAQTDELKVSGGVIQKIELTSLTIKDFNNLVDPHRNKKLYTAIRERLEANGGKADKAFGPDKPLFKPGKDGQPNGPEVRSVKKMINKLTGIPVRGGIAINDSMIRTDVFLRYGEFYLVPVYVHQHALPNKAITQYKKEQEWIEVKDNEFIFSIYRNDLIKISRKNKETLFGYYNGCDRANGNMSIFAHDCSSSVGVAGVIKSIGVKTASSLEKFNVDILGYSYSAPHEVRRGLA